VREHWHPAASGRRGAPFLYSDLAIQVLLTLKAVFSLAYRALEGFAGSLIRLTGLNLPVPDHTQRSRRSRTLRVAIPRRERSGPLHVVVDATGLKVFGEGECKVRQHGVGKRRTGLKVHLAVDADAKDVIAVEVTTPAWGDSEVFGGLLDQVEGRIGQVDGDGAYDTREVYEAGLARGVDVVVPPRENAVPWGAGHPRTRALADIAGQGLEGWKASSGYPRRCLAENAMYRLKQLFGGSVASRVFEAQVTEVDVRIAALNTMTTSACRYWCG